MHPNRLPGQAIVRAVVATSALLLLAGACSEPAEPKPLDKNGGGNVQEQPSSTPETAEPDSGTPSESPTPTTTDSRDEPMGPTEGVGTVTGPPQEAPSDPPSADAIDVCAMVPKAQIKKTYKFDRVEAKPSEIPAMAVPVYGCSYDGYKGKNPEPLTVSIKITPDTGLNAPSDVITEFSSGKTTPVPHLGDAAGLAPVETNVGGQTDQLIIAQSTDRGLTGVIVDGPPGIGAKPMSNIATRALDQL